MNNWKEFENKFVVNTLRPIIRNNTGYRELREFIDNEFISKAEATEKIVQIITSTPIPATVGTGTAVQKIINDIINLLK